MFFFKNRLHRQQRKNFPPSVAFAPGLWYTVADTKNRSRRRFSIGSLSKSGGAKPPGGGRCAVPLTGGRSRRFSILCARPVLRHGRVTGFSTWKAATNHKEGFGRIKIAPSSLSADFAHLGRDIQRISTADYVHVDVMDGVFVPNISVGLPVVKSIRPVTQLPLDVHLMIVEPLRYVERFCDAGADLVTVHLESDTPENTRQALERIHAKGKRAGIVLKPATPAQAAEPVVELTDLILVMTVEPGFGGQSFMADQLEKIRAIRALIDARHPACELEVDGGVGPDTFQSCIDAGANVLVAGSAVYGAEDIPARIALLRGGKC